MVFFDRSRIVEEEKTKVHINIKSEWEKMEVIRTGDVYTYHFKDNMATGIRECYRPFIVVEVGKESVSVVPLTIHLDNYKNNRKIYSTLTVNGITKDICILSDVLIKIPIQELEKKIAHVSPELVKAITADIKKAEECGEEIVVTDKDEMLRYLLENNELLKKSASKKTKWCERIISFILGVVASIIASYIYQLLS